MDTKLIKLTAYNGLLLGPMIKVPAWTREYHVPLLNKFQVACNEEDLTTLDPIEITHITFVATDDWYVAENRRSYQYFDLKLPK